jgi:hypothetical protein
MARAKLDMNATVKVGSGKVGFSNIPVDDGVDIPIKVTGAVRGTDKNGNPDIRLTFGQDGEVGKVARDYIGFGKEKGYNKYVEYLYYGGVMKKVGLDPNSQPTLAKLEKTFDKGVKALIGVRYLADIAHEKGTYQGKPTLSANIDTIRVFAEEKPEVSDEPSDDGFATFDEAKPAETPTEETTEDTDDYMSEE